MNAKDTARPTARLVVAAAMLALAAVLALSACAKSTPKTPQLSEQDRKAMVESVAKWYVAQGAADINGIRAGVYDPANLLGLATATPPAGVERLTVVWKWTGDKIVLTIPSRPDEPTTTVAASPTTPTVVQIDDGTGFSGTLYMTKVDGVWKIDAAETVKAADAAGAQGESTGPTEAP